jgi:hypothetical protein
MELRIYGPFALDLAFFLTVSDSLGPGTYIQVEWTDNRSVSFHILGQG